MINEENNRKIAKLLAEAARAGDLIQVCMCRMALGKPWEEAYGRLVQHEKDRLASLTVNYDPTTAYHRCLDACV